MTAGRTGTWVDVRETRYPRMQSQRIQKTRRQRKVIMIMEKNRREGDEIRIRLWRGSGYQANR